MKNKGNSRLEKQILSIAIELLYIQSARVYQHKLPWSHAGGGPKAELGQRGGSVQSFA